MRLFLSRGDIFRIENRNELISVLRCCLFSWYGILDADVVKYCPTIIFPLYLSLDGLFSLLPTYIKLKRNKFLA
jgi:hypothetical protein